MARDANQQKIDDINNIIRAEGNTFFQHLNTVKDITQIMEQLENTLTAFLTQINGLELDERTRTGAHSMFVNSMTELVAKRLGQDPASIKLDLAIEILQADARASLRAEIETARQNGVIITEDTVLEQFRQIGGIYKKQIVELLQQHNVAGETQTKVLEAFQQSLTKTAKGILNAGAAPQQPAAHQGQGAEEELDEEEEEDELEEKQQQPAPQPQPQGQRPETITLTPPQRAQDVEGKPAVDKNGAELYVITHEHIQKLNTCAALGDLLVRMKTSGNDHIPMVQFKAFEKAVNVGLQQEYDNNKEYFDFTKGTAEEQKIRIENAKKHNAYANTANASRFAKKLEAEVDGKEAQKIIDEIDRKNREKYNELKKRVEHAVKITAYVGKDLKTYKRAQARKRAARNIINFGRARPKTATAIALTLALTVITIKDEVLDNARLGNKTWRPAMAFVTGNDTWVNDGGTTSFRSRAGKKTTGVSANSDIVTPEKVPKILIKDFLLQKDGGIKEALNRGLESMGQKGMFLNSKVYKDEKPFSSLCVQFNTTTGKAQIFAADIPNKPLVLNDINVTERDAMNASITHVEGSTQVNNQKRNGIYVLTTDFNLNIAGQDIEFSEVIDPRPGQNARVLELVLAQ